MSVQWDLEQMRLFVSVAEQRSFSAVARGQRKAQSAVSNGIALLEAKSGTDLNAIATKLKSEGVNVQIELSGAEQQPK